MNIDIDVDASSALSYLQRLSDQAPFATSLALNRVANHVQQDIRSEVSKRFTLRRPDFILNTIKINREDRATKTNLEATVRIDPTRDILAKFEAGGLKTPRDGGSIAIPTEHVRRTKKEIITKTQRPRALLDSRSAGKGRVFKTQKAILQVVGSLKRGVTRALYILKPSVRIAPRLGFVRTATSSVERHWVDEMTKAFNDAERTARK